MANHLKHASTPDYPRYYLADDAEVHVIASGGPQDRAILGLYPDRAVILFQGNCTPGPVSSLLRELLAANRSLAVKSVLLDFTQFTGMIDWDFAKSRNNRVWDEQRPDKFAYVMQSSAALMIAKGLAAFVDAECGIFLKHADAFRWLGWEEAAFATDLFGIADSA